METDVGFTLLSSPQVAEANKKRNKRNDDLINWYARLLYMRNLITLLLRSRFLDTKEMKKSASAAQWMFFMVMLQLRPWSEATTIAKKGCVDRCGNISVPYPFGIGDSGSSCSMYPFFLLTCDTSFSPPRLTFANSTHPVTNISVDEGTVNRDAPMAYTCYNATAYLDWIGTNFSWAKQFPYFTLSDKWNKLTAVGCNTVGYYLSEGGVSLGGGCVSTCDRAPNLPNQTACSGIGSGCCQTDIQRRVHQMTVYIGNVEDESTMWESNPCKYAFLADHRTANIKNIIQHLSKDSTSNVVYEWVVDKKTCEDAQANTSSYRCRGNARCDYSENGEGYRCLCKPGFIGNPYLEACTDIDECKNPKAYPCKGTCKNTEGNYACSCPFGMRGDGKIACHLFQISTIAAIIGAVIFVVAIGLLTIILLTKRRREKNFLRNGGVILKNQRVRIFREAELAKATGNYDTSHFLGEGGFSTVYKGDLEDDTKVAVKVPKKTNKAQLNHEEFQHEISIISQVNHKNVVKLLGLCLETEIPHLVYEFISNGTLYQHIHDDGSRIITSWKERLRVAAEAAHAFHYLHSLADPPIIHGDVKATNILLDENHKVKISDFGASVLISSGYRDVASKIQGTLGYLDPEYLMTGELTTASDVYSFGVVLLELLTGMRPNIGTRTGKTGSMIQHFVMALEANDISRVVCFNIRNDNEMEEVETFAEIARRCINSSGVKRPTMKQVAEELTRVARMDQSLWTVDNEETEQLLDKIYVYSPENTQADIVSISTFSVDLYSISI